MSTFHLILNLFSYFIFFLGGFIVWLDKKNIPALIQLPFFISAILIPLYVIDYSERFSDETIKMLTSINFLGACSIILGIFFGKIISIQKFTFFIKYYNYFVTLLGPRIIKFRRIVLLIFVSCLLITLCFIYMGVLPIFADNPMEAKFFKGGYKIRYDDISIIFRFFQSFLFVAIPLSFMLIIQKCRPFTKLILLFLIFWSVMLFVVNLYRGPVLYGLILMLALLASETKIKTFLFIFFISFVYSFGSIIYILIGVNDFPVDFNFFTEIAKGLPDIQDHLIFISNFKDDLKFTYGLSFFGGLIPGNFIYNPAVYTLSVINLSTDISQIASGGLRMPVYLHSFMAFSWAGVCFFSFLYGVLLTRYTLIYKSMDKNNFFNFAISTFWFIFVAQFFLNFYHLKYQNLLMIIFLIMILGSRIKIK